MLSVRGDTAFLAVSGRAGRYRLQGAALRLGLVVLLVLLAVPDRPTVTLLTLLAGLGPVLTVVTARRGGRGSTVAGPLDLLGAVALLTAAALVTTGPPWVPVTALAVATRYLVSVVIAAGTSPTWYDPHRSAAPAQNTIRAAAAPMVLGLVLAAAVLGDNPAGWSVGLTLAVAGAAYAAAGIRATDRFAVHADDLVRRARLDGQQQVLRELHRSLLRPLSVLTDRTHDVEPVDPTLVRLAQTATTRYDRIEAVVTRGVEDDDLTEVGDQLTALAGATACSLTLELAEAQLEAPTDRALAARTLQDLVGNALDAGSTRIEAVVGVRSGWASVQVADDGSPMPTSGWQAPGTSSASLAAELSRRGGLLTQHPRDPHLGQQRGKTVTARWSIDG